MLLLLVGLPLALLWQVYVTRQLTRLLNIHQIEEYQNGRFWLCVRAVPKRLGDVRHVPVGVGLLALWLLALVALPQVWMFALLVTISAAYPLGLALSVEEAQAKKPLVYTARAKRLLSA